jgi:mRNA-degrading endonuclease toxin of MazEF toxin-antitoxin module
VWKAKDSKINLLGSLTRTIHPERYCVILSNDQMCNDGEWPLVLIAPLSHVLHPKAKPDMLIPMTATNGLTVQSRLMLSQIQPLQKIDLQERLGQIEQSHWEEVVRRVFWHIRR